MAPKDKREAILDAALVLFAERGFHGTAVPLVAERAGVGAGTIYRYFASKEELVNALYQQWKLAMIDALVADFPFHAEVREQFRTFWRRWAGFVLERPRVATFLELHHHAPYLDARSRGVEAQMMTFVTGFFEQARAAGVVRDAPAPVLIAIVHGVFVGMVKAHMDDRLALDPPTIDAFEVACWAAIARP